jgi:tRNA A37 threonylcarbamoyladenosine synthetase subunit TsaC/SUA5/YrdC
VLKSLSGFDAILAERELPAGRESTVVDASGPDAKIVRQGAISQDAIRKVLADARL